MDPGSKTKKPEELTESEAELELRRLAKEIAIYDDAYHRDDSPIIQDSEYDSIFERNKRIENLFPHLIREDSASNRVGAGTKDGFSKVSHFKPMLSLNNSFKEEDLFDFVTRIRRFLKIPIETMVEIVGEP